MGLLYTNYESKNSLNINACSGGIYKTFKESWFTRFNLKSEIAETLFKPYGNEIRTAADKYEYGYRTVHKETCVVLQMIICGDMEVIAEVIREEDFNRYFELEGGSGDDQ